MPARAGGALPVRRHPRARRLSSFYWSLNPDSRDTGGLLGPGWRPDELSTAKLALLADAAATRVFDVLVGPSMPPSLAARPRPPPTPPSPPPLPPALPWAPSAGRVALAWLASVAAPLALLAGLACAYRHRASGEPQHKLLNILGAEPATTAAAAATSAAAGQQEPQQPRFV